MTFPHVWVQGRTLYVRLEQVRPLFRHGVQVLVPLPFQHDAPETERERRPFRRDVPECVFFSYDDDGSYVLCRVHESHDVH